MHFSGQKMGKLQREHPAPLRRCAQARKRADAPEFAAIRKEVWACKLDRGNIRANAEKYLLDIGVPQAHIDAFREIMLEK